jgi:hypothetical protein
MHTLISMAKVVPIMARLVALLLALTPLVSCAGIGAGIGEAIPTWAGGMPKNLPPRPGTPEYEEYKNRLEGRSKIDTEQQDSRNSDVAN